MRGIWIRLDLRYRLSRLREKAIMKFAWALPREVVYWCGMRMMAHATQGRWGMDSPDSVGFKMFDRWGQAR